MILFYCSSFLGMMSVDPVVAGEGRSLINKHYLHPLPRGWHSSCHEMGYNKRETKLKKEKKRKKFSPLCPLSCMLGHRPTSTLQGLHIDVATHNCGISPRTEVHPPGYTATPHTFHLTNPRHSLLSCTILLSCLTSNPLSLNTLS